MIQNEREYEVTLERIAYFQRQVAHMRNVERNPANFRLSAGGFLAEIDRMNREVREYLSTLPSNPATALEAVH